MGTRLDPIFQRELGQRSQVLSTAEIEKLWQQFQVNQDQQAKEIVFWSIARLVVGLAARKGRAAGRVNDYVQHALLITWEKLDGFRVGKGTLASYVKQIIVRELDAERLRTCYPVNLPRRHESSWKKCKTARVHFDSWLEPAGELPP